MSEHTIVIDKVFCHVARPDGYNGHTIVAGIAYHDHKLIEVYDFGCHVSPCLPMDIEDLPEAKWLLMTHPMAKKYYQILPRLSNMDGVKQQEETRE